MSRRPMTYRHCQPRTRSATPLARFAGLLGNVLLWCGRRALCWGLRVPALLAIIGVVMRLTIRDRFETISYLHYGTPWSIIALLAFVAALISWCRPRSGVAGRRRLMWSGLFAGLSLLAGLAWWSTDFERGTGGAPLDAEAGPVMRIVLWNAEAKLRWPASLRALQDVDPDIAVMVECGRSVRVRPQVEKLLGQTHRMWAPGGSMVVLSRNELTPDPGSQRDRGWWNYDPVNRFLGLSTRFEGRPLRILGVDVYSKALNERRVAAGHAARMGREDEVPTIVLGDFNTPPDSVWFEPMRADFVHAFERAGNGYAPTWPEPVPVLQLDHVWLERGAFEVVQVQQIDTGLSDHRMLVVDVQFVE